MAPLTPSPLVREDEVFLRMNVAERIQHALMVVSFVTLIVTGLPLVFYELKIFKSIFAFGRAFYIRGILHRVAAVILIIDVLWHLGYTLFTARGRRNFREMRPGLKDARDALQAFGYNVGLTRWLHARGRFRRFFARHPFWIFAEPPAYGRYNFIEKLEYLSVAWGSAVMIASGFFMWKVEWSLRIFPLWVHDIFVIVHGYEAMLAFLAIIIWHMYNVHLNPEVFPMSRVWLDGKISGHELRTLHPLEYEGIVEERRRAAGSGAGEPRPADTMQDD
jgi:formate dehydrogenase subunit gamma